MGCAIPDCTYVNNIWGETYHHNGREYCIFHLPEAVEGYSANKFNEAFTKLIRSGTRNLNEFYFKSALNLELLNYTEWINIENSKFFGNNHFSHTNIGIIGCEFFDNLTIAPSTNLLNTNTSNPKISKCVIHGALKIENVNTPFELDIISAHKGSSIRATIIKLTNCVFTNNDDDEKHVLELHNTQYFEANSTKFNLIDTSNSSINKFILKDCTVNNYIEATEIPKRIEFNDTKFFPKGDKNAENFFRRMKKHYEDQHNWWEAARFFKYEKTSERLQKKWWGKIDLNTLYWLLNDYGYSYWRPVCWMALLWFVFALLFYQIEGFKSGLGWEKELATYNAYAQSLFFSAEQVVLPLTFPANLPLVPATFAGWILSVVHGFTTILLGTMSVLSIRKRFKV